MASMKAIIVMIIWTIIAAWIVNTIGLVDHSRSLAGAIGGGIALLIILMVNVWLYFLIARDEPWKWFKE